MQDLLPLDQFNWPELNANLKAVLPERSYVSDLTLALTNLVSIVEHLAFTAAKTAKNSYYDLIQNVQKIAERMFVILEIPKETSTIARDLLASSMRLMEVGTKQLGLNQRQLAEDFFQKAYELYLLFVNLSLHLITKDTLQALDQQAFITLQKYLSQFAIPNVAPQEIERKTEAVTPVKEFPFKNLNDFIEKVDSLKKQNRMDLSSDQDLTMGIMNLVNLEEEFFLLGAEHKNQDFYATLLQVREMRKTFLQTIIQKYEGEVWCISKHLLAAAMRCIQGGTKLIASQQSKLAYEIFQFAYDLYMLFWALNLGILDNNSYNKPKGLLGTLGSLIKKAIDCCIE